MVCPRDHQSLEFEGGNLLCPNRHKYPVVDDVPIMLLDDVPQTLAVGNASLEAARGRPDSDRLFINTLGCSEEEKQEIRKLAAAPDPLAPDPVVQYLVAATNGHLYKQLLGRLNAIPLPQLRLPPGNRKSFLDIGCNWGRWCLSAARKGYEVVGIDPSLGAILAARRTAAKLGLSASYVVGDARYLPFRSGCFSTAFSYSVLQHFSKGDAIAAIHEVSRILDPGGVSFIQMPNAFGIRSLQHQLRRRFKDPQGFDVRYWTVAELRKTFQRLIGETELSVDGFFGLGIQASDLQMMPLQYRVVIRASEALRRVSESFPGLCWVADSLYVRSTRNAPSRANN